MPARGWDVVGRLLLQLLLATPQLEARNTGGQRAQVAGANSGDGGGIDESHLEYRGVAALPGAAA